MNIEESLKIKLIGFANHEAGKFSAILDLAQFGLRPSWRIVDKDDADFFLLPQKSSTSTINAPAGRLLIYGIEKNADNPNMVLIDPDGVPRIHSLIALLNRLASQLTPLESSDIARNAAELRGQPESAQAAAEAVAPPSDPIHFDPNQGLLKHFLELPNQPLVILQKSADRQLFTFINPDKQTFYSQASLEEIAAYFDVEHNILTKTISYDELDAIVKKSAMAPQLLKNLIWHCTLKSSQGKLLIGHSGQDPVQLTQWPFLGAGSRPYIKLATYLKNNAANLATAAEVTGVAINVVYDFYNACYLTGIIEKSTETDLAPKVDNTEKKNLLGKIRKRLEK